MKRSTRSWIAAVVSLLFVASCPTFASPSISSFAPAFGEPGDQVTLAGYELDGVSRVAFNGTPAAYLIVNSEKIVAVVPDGATTGHITIDAPRGSAASLLPFGVAPRVHLFTPVSTAADKPVEVGGDNFVIGATTVVIAGATSQVVQVTAPDHLTAWVPPGATNGPIVVITEYGQGNSTDSFTRSETPVIASFTPTNGPPGTEVLLQGANFTGVTSVTLNDRPTAFTFFDDNLVGVVIPNPASSGRFAVKSVDTGTGMSGSPFTVSPRIFGFSPGRALPNDLVQVNCSDLTRLAEVKIGDTIVPAANLRSPLPTELWITVPSGAMTGPISITTARGSTTTMEPLIIGPEIGSFSPTSGPVGAKIAIEGPGLLSATAVAFGDTKTMDFDVNRATLSTRVPAGASNGLVRVITPSGIATSAIPFLVTSGLLPNISDFSPAQGVPGVVVTILGIQLAHANAVLFNGIPATEFRVLDDSTVEAMVPYQTSTGSLTGPITVTTPYGSVDSTQSFTSPEVVLEGPLPPIAAASADGAVVLSWDADFLPYRLESTDNRQDATSWRPVEIDPLLVDGKNYVTNPAPPGAQFFRLRYP